MGRRKSVREIQKQLQYAQAREAYNPPVRESGAATQRRPKLAVKYAVLSPLAEADAAFTIQASKEGLEFFGGIAALGLAAVSTDPQAPRGFKPARILATVADATPQLIRAQGSNRPYIRYGRGARGSNAQYNYTAPITADTPANLKSKVTTVITAKKTAVGGAYGRIWFEPEDYPYSASGE
ncbi:hypothetical protein VF14_35215 [Nostoc linckia z18]|uniref:Uncharacterized protein n=2 Tax=Nostoc linckia TaxID=92942 RepID=A0A9Q6EHB3_NOSLI|nr:hypothetical protein [Nostoc linckia]PHK28923.1 hypothetical protein VF12_31920 [Nostoc linckia z15]PHK38846.1 hypothetical protein VF13_35375 [Nostoc linckia z16]PHJ54496.1 hypothetical protein VF02_36690 [Nostoc linckia z1]PHJ57581.1 hypothetical protein VF05_35470 [Nostoc linckia z3]PHJ58996.1 hypothetical protein VF03_34975 [Nostoc linckia z2]